MTSMDVLGMIEVYMSRTDSFERQTVIFHTMVITSTPLKRM